MSQWLMSISIGPVQSFIAAARKTRDLWYGSHLLSELSKAAALHIFQNGGRLILPGVADDATQAAQDLKSGSEFIVGNKILAIVDTDAPMADYVSEIRSAVDRYWRDQVDHAYKELEDSKTSIINKGVWDSQIYDVIEFYAAWIPYTTEAYATLKSRVEHLLSGRKTLRNFTKNPLEVGKLPKSSLDGARDTVLLCKQIDKQIDKNLKRRLSRYDISDGEQLDLVGVVKRVQGRSRSFPPIVNIAVRPWLDFVFEKKKNHVMVDAICEICSKDEIDRFKGINAPHDRFEFDASVLYQNRIHALKKDHYFSNDDNYENLNSSLDVLYRQFGEPNSYIAVLLADGDGMGQFLNKQGDTVEKHQLISRTLSEFATKVKTVVQAHRGNLVYSGGDDVLAFVPIIDSIQLAHHLHETFRETMKKLTSYKEFSGLTLDDLPTLSVGLAWGHVMEPLRDLLDYARKAESISKRPNKNALGILLQTRSGGHELSARVRWDAVCAENPSQRVLSLIEELVHDLRRESLSTAIVHDFLALRDRYASMEMNLSTLTRVVEGEMLMVIRKKKPKSKDKEAIESSIRRVLSVYQSVMGQPQRRESFQKAMDDFVNWMLLIRWFYQNTRKEPMLTEKEGDSNGNHSHSTA